MLNSNTDLDDCIHLFQHNPIRRNRLIPSSPDTPWQRVTLQHQRNLHNTLKCILRANPLHTLIPAGFVPDSPRNLLQQRPWADGNRWRHQCRKNDKSNDESRDVKGGEVSPENSSDTLSEEPIGQEGKHVSRGAKNCDMHGRPLRGLHPTLLENGDVKRKIPADYKNQLGGWESGFITGFVMVRCRVTTGLLFFFTRPLSKLPPESRKNKPRLGHNIQQTLAQVNCAREERTKQMIVMKTHRGYQRTTMYVPILVVPVASESA